MKHCFHNYAVESIFVSWYGRLMEKLRYTWKDVELENYIGRKNLRSLIMPYLESHRRRQEIIASMNIKA